MSYRSKKEKQFADQLTSAGVVFETNANDLPGTPDIVFREAKLVIFFNGCFWHGHHCSKPPKDYEWQDKIRNIQQRDLQNIRELKQVGFSAYTVWECQFDEDSERYIKTIVGKVRRSQAPLNETKK